jgi:hypothetical protein
VVVWVSKNVSSGLWTAAASVLLALSDQGYGVERKNSETVGYADFR